MTESNTRIKRTRVGGWLQLAPCVYLAPCACLAVGALVSCTSSVSGDGTQTSEQPEADGGKTDTTTESSDAGVEETSSTTQHSSTTQPATSTVNPTTNSTTTGSTDVQPSVSPQTTGAPSSEVNSSDDDTTEPTTTDDETSDSTNNDAGSTEETTSETTDPVPGGTGIFVALGHGQRTIVSCDDGQTWSHNRFTDDIPLSGTDTDEIPFSMRAASYANGAFYVAWGWGAPSYVERSFDGVNWEGIYGVAAPDERSGDDWIWGLVAGGNNVIMGENRQVFLSSDQGANWDVGDFGLVAQKVILGYGDGAFVAISEGRPEQSDPKFLRSPDGVNWSNDVDVPDNCFGGRVTSIPYLDGTFLFAAGSHFCRSTDDGQSWQYSAAASGQIRASLHDGTRFISMTDNGSLFASADAVDWEQVGQLQGSGGGIAFGASKTTGTLVGVRGGVFYRSDDGGASFDELPGSAYIAEGGPIAQIEFGTVASSDACP